MKKIITKLTFVESERQVAYDRIIHQTLDLRRHHYQLGLCIALNMQDLGHALPSGRYPLLEVLTNSRIRGLYNLAIEKYGYRAGRSCFSAAPIRGKLPGVGAAGVLWGIK